MFNLTRKVLLGGVVACLAIPAFAADLYEPPVEEAPVVPTYQPVEFGGWYIRGDLDYHASRFGGADYVTYGVDDCDPCGPLPVAGSNTFEAGKLREAFSLGGGVGYQVTNHFRTDATIDWLGKSKFRGSTVGNCLSDSSQSCSSTDETSYSALLLLANAYVDLGTWNRITPYVGAGIGGAHVKWDDLTNTIHDVDGNDYTSTHPGAKGWRFAYALTAGASYCLTDNLNFDLGYRFTHINGGKMFGQDTINVVGPGYDKGIDVHEVRGGLRYQFGGSPGCATPQVAYEPQPEPIYTK